ncbi:MAG: hypothetical protein ACRDRI_20675 [Pseudonocardiaceae bacterium]
MVPRGDPAPLRWLIGVELARYRNLAKLSLTQATERAGPADHVARRGRPARADRWTSG